MTNISKCLTVFAAVACLAFLGVVSVSAIGGPNFDAHKADPTLSGVSFTDTPNEETGGMTYSAETRRKLPSDPNNANSELAAKSIVQNSKNLPQTILSVRKHVAQTQREYEDALDKKIAQRIVQIKEAKDLLAIDKTAMDARMASLNQLLVATQQTLQKIDQDAVDTGRKTLEKAREAARRKQEIERLRNQVEELIDDQYRLKVQLRKLDNLLVRLREINARLERRRQNLIRQGAVSN